MKRIDTKELRELSSQVDEYCSHFDAQKIESSADELDRLYQLETELKALKLATTPLSHKELETVLKEEGWKWIKRKNNFKRRVDELWFTHDESAIIKNGYDFCLPLSAVTRATLRRCGVIK